MLLDIYVLKKGFSELLTLTAPPSTAPNPGYLKRVAQSMSRIDPILKTLQVRPSPPEALVQAYLIHIADKSDANFRKILDLKGLRKQDQSHLLDLFQAHRASPRNTNLPQSSPLLTPLIVQSGAAATGVTLTSTLSSQLSSAASVSTSNLQARFDPTTFGSAIISAARDSVDRFGSPALVGTSPNPTSSGFATPSPQPEIVTAPPPTPAPIANTLSLPIPPVSTSSTPGNLNENLRNLGKFFKRDVGSFSGRFGGTGNAAKGNDDA